MMSVGVLLAVGVLLVLLGLFGPAFPVLVLGVVALVIAGLIEVLGQRRTHAA